MIVLNVLLDKKLQCAGASVLQDRLVDAHSGSTTSSTSLHPGIRQDRLVDARSGLTSSSTSSRLASTEGSVDARNGSTATTSHRLRQHKRPRLQLHRRQRRGYLKWEVQTKRVSTSPSILGETTDHLDDHRISNNAYPCYHGF